MVTLPGKGTLCIEAKFESGEARYPRRRKERDIFRQRGLCLVRQTDVQRLIFDLLGIHAQFRFLVDGKGGEANENVMTWQRVFDVMDKGDLPPFIRRWDRSAMTQLRHLDGRGDGVRELNHKAHDGSVWEWCRAPISPS